MITKKAHDNAHYDWMLKVYHWVDIPYNITEMSKLGNK